MLHGQRVTLRPVRADDVDRLTEILREPEVARWWGDSDAERFRKELIEEPDAVIYAIEAEGEVSTFRRGVVVRPEYGRPGTVEPFELLAANRTRRSRHLPDRSQ